MPRLSRSKPIVRKNAPSLISGCNSLDNYLVISVVLPKFRFNLVLFGWGRSRSMIWKSFGLALAGVVVISSHAKAEVNPEGQSILCKKQSWLTEIAISTPKFVVAICINKNDPGNVNSYELTPTHYIGQSKSTGGKIILPLTESNNLPGEPSFYKAVNGQYTYQVYVSQAQRYSSACQCWATNIDTITLSIFKNGQRISRYQTDKYISGWK